MEQRRLGGHERGRAGRATVRDPDARFMLTAKHGRSACLGADGRRADLRRPRPGPRAAGAPGRSRRGHVRQRRTSTEGVSIHWHGVDVPNAEDGVAGVTQDAVAPGGVHVTASGPIRSGRSGTTRTSPRRGGAARPLRRLRDRAREPAEPEEPSTSPWSRTTCTARPRSTASTSRRREPWPRHAGSPAARQLGRTPQRLMLHGHALPCRRDRRHRPERADAARGRAPTGRRRALRRRLHDAGRRRCGSRSRNGGRARASAPTDDGRPLTGRPGPRSTRRPTARPAATPFDAKSRFDRSFDFEIGRKPGFLDGRPGIHWAINGSIFPDVPVFVVRRGDLVEVEIVNDTDVRAPDASARPPLLVLSRDGVPVSGARGGRTPSTSAAASATRSRSTPTTPGSDGSLPQPPARRRRPDDARRLRRRADAVQRRRRRPQPPRITRAIRRPDGAARRGRASPGRPGDAAGQPDDEQGVDRMEEADRRNLEAEPREEHLQDQQAGERGASG